MNLKNMDIPKMKDDVTFEYFVKSLLLADTQAMQNVNLNGRLGQKQDGVDVFAKRIPT